MGHKVYVVSRAGRQCYQLKWTDPVTGQSRFKTTDIAATGKPRESKRAERAAAELAQALDAGQTVAPQKVTWEEFRRQYERDAIAGLAKGTREQYASSLDRFTDVVKPRLLCAVDGLVLTRFANARRNAGIAEATIAKDLRTLRACFNWGVEHKFMVAVPPFPTAKRARKSSKKTPMKGRPVTAEEFDRMLAAVPHVVDTADVEGWRWYLTGLWYSGLRLAESLVLSWDVPGHLRPEFPAGRRPLLHVPADQEKGNQDRLLPLAPEFALLLAAVPQPERTGPVFKAPATHHPRTVGGIVSRIGEKARVVVNDSGKTASAHDLRRSFGDRWAVRVMPAVLMELMRHESIETTLRYYVGRDADRTADAAWDAYRKTEALGDKMGDTAICQSVGSVENA